MINLFRQSDRLKIVKLIKHKNTIMIIQIKIKILPSIIQINSKSQNKGFKVQDFKTKTMKIK